MMTIPGPIEAKVTAAAQGSTAVAILTLIVLHYVPWLNGQGVLVSYVIAALLSGIGGFVSGYLAKHTPRPDLEGVKPPVA